MLSRVIRGTSGLKWARQHWRNWLKAWAGGAFKIFGPIYLFFILFIPLFIVDGFQMYKLKL